MLGPGPHGAQTPEGSALAQPAEGDRGAAQVGLEDELLDDEGGHPELPCQLRLSQPAPRIPWPRPALGDGARPVLSKRKPSAE